MNMCKSYKYTVPNCPLAISFIMTKSAEFRGASVGVFGFWCERDDSTHKKHNTHKFMIFKTNLAKHEAAPPGVIQTRIAPPHSF